MIYTPNGKAVSQNTVTYQQLFAILIDIQKLQNTSPAFVVFNGTKIKRFYEQNNFRIQVMQKTLKELTDLYVKKTEDGKLATINVNGNIEYDFETVDLKQEYLKAYNDFMSISFEFHI